jgi:hypothetical protein
MATPRTALTSDDIPPGPLSEDDLRQQWNAQADEFNQWDSLETFEQLAWAQALAIKADRHAAALKAEPEGEGPSEKNLYDLAAEFNGDPVPAMRRALEVWGNPLQEAPAPGENLATLPSPEAPGEALAARPLLEKVAAMADRIGIHTVGEITAISDRAAAWLRDNPPGQPVAREPRGCPTPGACSCVEPTPPAPEPGEVAQLVALLKIAGRWATSTGVHLDRFAALFAQQAAELAALRGVPVAVSERPWDREGWCDAEGRCWLGSPGNRLNDHGWVYRKPCELLHQMFSLPHDAIPLPAPQAGEGEA